MTLENCSDRHVGSKAQYTHIYTHVILSSSLSFSLSPPLFFSLPPHILRNLRNGIYNKGREIVITHIICYCASKDVQELVTHFHPGRECWNGQESSLQIILYPQKHVYKLRHSGTKLLSHCWRSSSRKITSSRSTWSTQVDLYTGTLSQKQKWPSHTENTAYAEKTSVKFLPGVSDFSNLVLHSLTATKTNGEHRPSEAASGTAQHTVHSRIPAGRKIL